VYPADLIGSMYDLLGIDREQAAASTGLEARVTPTPRMDCRCRAIEGDHVRQAVWAAAAVAALASALSAQQQRPQIPHAGTSIRRRRKGASIKCASAASSWMAPARCIFPARESRRK